METKHFYDLLIKVQSVARIGLTFSRDPYALENYQKLLDLTTEFLNDFQNVDLSPNGYFERNIYPTPNVSVRTVCFNENGEVLLVKEVSDGGYSLPGGWCEIDESPTEAARGECLEEAGADVEIIRLVGVINRSPFKSPTSVREYALIFEGKVKGELKAHDYEIIDASFFPLDDLPPFSKKVTKEENMRMIMAAKNKKVIFD